jgi:glutathione S-transferase
MCHCAGEHKITQSNAIMRYLARKNGLLGKSEEEMVRVDMLTEQCMDFRNGLVGLAYDSNFVSSTSQQMITVFWSILKLFLQDQLKAGYLKALPAKLVEFQKFLGSRGAIHQCLRIILNSDS